MKYFGAGIITAAIGLTLILSVGQSFAQTVTPTTTPTPTVTVPKSAPNTGFGN